MKSPRRLLRHPFLMALAAMLLAGLPMGAAEGSAWWTRLGMRDLSGAPAAPAGRWLVVVFIGQDCPVSNASIPDLNKLASEFGPRGFSFIGAYVDPTVDLAALKAHAADYGIGFPVVDDRGHALAKAAGATYTPQACLFAADGSKLYLGRIDDRVGERGVARPVAAHQDLRDVLVALASGAKGPFESKAGYGCAIPEAVHP